jgi:peroxiredoxin
MLCLWGALGCNKTTTTGSTDTPVYAEGKPSKISIDIDNGAQTTAPDKPGVAANPAFSTQSLTDELSRLRADAAALGPDQVYNETYFRTLRANAAQPWGIDVAATAPGFVLKDANGDEISLDKLRDSKQPVLIYFYRGGWSPTSTAELKWLATAYPELQKMGAQVVAVTPEQASFIADTVRTNKINFPVVSDPGATTAQSYRIGYQPDGTLVTTLQNSYGVNLADRNGTGPTWLPMNSLYLVDPGGNVVWRSFESGVNNGVDFNGALTELQRIQTSAAARAENSNAADRAQQSEQAEDRAEGSDASDRANGSDASNR